MQIYIDKYPIEYWDRYIHVTNSPDLEDDYIGEDDLDVMIRVDYPKSLEIAEKIKALLEQEYPDLKSNL